MRRQYPTFAYTCTAVLATALLGSYAQADALVVTQAMKASTIAEIFVEDDGARVEIEIGAQDVAAFANVLPDELYTKVTGKSAPLQERLETFLAFDWKMTVDGEPLLGELRKVTPAKRVVRDEATGDALPEQPEDAEFVIRLTLSYPWESRPQTLSIRPPTATNGATANIGFVCYHNGLPVNDFRYLSQEVTLDLDWEDPWYSRFRHPNLRRQYDAPISAFLYVEPYEVRKEIIIRPRDVETWIDLDLPNDGIIPVEQQEEVKQRIADYLSEKNPVTINGEIAQGRLDRIHFVHRTLRTTGIIEPPVDLDANSATLGAIFVYPVDKLPEEVSMRWELFSPKIQVVPAATSDEAGGLPAQVTADAPLLTWNNHLTNPSSPRILKVDAPPLPQRLTIPLASVICGAVALLIAGWHVLRRSGFANVSFAATMAAVTASLLLLPFAKASIDRPFQQPAALAREEAQGILSNLLHNVYRSFDHHDESLIYDRLAKSISGDLLAEVYLETRQSMEVKNQGGLRISVKEVVVSELGPIGDDAREPTYRCRWRVSGWIGHWGHTHRRANEHLAEITIAPRDGMWKITKLEMLDEQNVAAGQGDTAT